MHTYKRSEGFTLIEMLIVIAIIGILASVVLVGLGPVQRRGRDARRQSDLREVQNALELYFNKCGYYPGQAAPAATNCTGYTPIATWKDLSDALTGSALGVSNIPTDPNSSAHYTYVANSNGTSYLLKAKLEDSGNPALTNKPVIPADIDGTCDANDYCIVF